MFAEKKIPNVRINWKYYLMSVAEVVDAFRMIPRVMVAGYAWLVWVVVDWFMHLPNPTSQHAFLVSTIVGGAAAVFGLYVNSGVSWSRKSADKVDYIEHCDTDRYMPLKQPRSHQSPWQQEPDIKLDAGKETPPDNWLDD